MVLLGLAVAAACALWILPAAASAAPVPNGCTQDVAGYEV